jgi:hypothetical protein
MFDQTTRRSADMNPSARRLGRRPTLAQALLAAGALAATFAVTMVVALLTAAVADAASISYIGADGNVHLVSPDGQRKLQLTTNATADNKYRSPSQADSGRVVALRKASSTSGLAVFIERDGTQSDAWNLPASGTGVPFAPFNGGQISPEGNGGMLAYDYWHADGPLSTPKFYTDVRVGFASGGGMTNPCLINCHGGYLRPRWLPGTPFAGFVNKGFSRVDIQRAGSAAPTPWIALNDPSQFNIESFDVARSGGRVVVEVTPETTDTSSFEFYGFSGAPGNPIGFVCVAQNVAASTSYPRYSPDGTMISWTGSDGVYVSPAPVHGPGGICNLQPKLVAPGGSQADWGKVDVPAAHQPDDPNDPNDPSDPIDPVDPPKTPDAVKKGLVVELQCPEACDAAVTASVNKATAKRYGLGRKAAKVASGKASAAAAGPVEVALAFKGKAKRKLAKAKKLKLALVAKLKLASGATETLKGSLTLKK